MIALIPCRAGSKRVERKNFRELAGKPLLLHTYEAAVESEVFSRIAFCSDDIWAVVKLVNAKGPPVHFVSQSHPLHRDDCWDIEWVTDALKRVLWERHAHAHDCGHCELGTFCIPEFAILRPTSPFRDAETIKRAKTQWDSIKGNYDSMRAITPAPVHPMKTWSYDPDSHEMWALMKAAHHKHMHSRPTQTLGDFYAQTAALEMAHTRTPLHLGTIAGDRIAGFLTCGPEALDVNTEEDWAYAGYLSARLPILKG